MHSETYIINKLHALFPSTDGRIGIGDDAGLLQDGTLISTDAMVENVHFLRGEASWAEVAYKLFASNGSDMAAMGGKAEAYFLSLGMPSYWQDENLDEFIAGVQEFLKEYPADLLGGDLVKSPVFFASVTVTGKAYQHPWLRTGAQVGDAIYVTGTLGCSRLYLNKLLGQNILPFENENYFRVRHYKPTPRSVWAEMIGAHMPVHAAMDVSDGLCEDLTKLCKSSGLGFVIEANSVPIAKMQIGLENYRQYKDAYLKEALIGGEDYELIIVSPLQPEMIKKLDIPLTKIGTIQKKESYTVLLNSKEYSAEEFKGYRHS